MLVAPVDALYVWIGLTAASVALFGVVSAVPAAPPPDADGAAGTVDRVAASQYAAVGEHPMTNAHAVRVGADTISLRGPGGVADATIGYGPVVSADRESLRRVLLGEPPERVFASPAAFEAEIERAHAGAPEWHETDRLVVRRVSWEGTDVTLVG